MECQILNYQRQKRNEHDHQDNPKMNSYILEKMVCKSLPHCVCHAYEPEESSIHFLDHLDNYVYRPSRIQDNMQKEIRYE